MWQVGRPRRSSSSSMQGRSSWTRVEVWRISTAHALASASDSFPASASQAARHKMGRIRFPPARVVYRIASWISEGGVSEGGRNFCNALLTFPFRLFKYALSFCMGDTFVCFAESRKENPQKCLPSRRVGAFGRLTRSKDIVGKGDRGRADVCLLRFCFVYRILEMG